MPLCQIHCFKYFNTGHSYCYLSSLRNADTAIVFVHGFLGNAIDTWQHFPSLVDDLSNGISWWATCDLYFWNYSSAEQTINQSAAQLREFLKSFIPVPSTRLLSFTGAAIATDQEIIRKSTEYKRLILVGHSQGGVVIRQLIVDVIKDWIAEGERPLTLAGQSTFSGSVLNADLHLFSPPLHGTALTGVPAILYQIPVTRWLFEALLTAYSPAYRQLTSESVPLEMLRESTSKYYNQYHFAALVAHIYYADHERIVSDLIYPFDPPATYLADQTHTSVCKPCPGYLEPLEVIRRAATRSASAT